VYSFGVLFDYSYTVLAGDFSDQLEAWLRGDGEKTLGALTRDFGEKSFAALVLVLMFVPALPLPTGGISHVFEAVTVVVGVEMAAGLETVWLPARWARRPLGAVATERAIPFILRWVRRAERVSRPRGAGLIRQRWMRRILGLVFIVFAAAAALAPPFSGLDTLPAMGAVAVALAILFEDAVLLGAGLLVGAGGVALVVAAGAAIVHIVGSVL
jgi:hypothetical protein